MTDRRLVAAAQAGSRDAVGELFTRHWRGAWKTAFAVTGNRVWADDVAQDGFERAIRNLHRFDGRRPFAAWLHRIVVNRALDLLRHEQRLVELDENELVALASSEPALPDRQLARAFGRLSPEHRVVVVLRHALGYSLAETAELLEVPVGTVQSRLARALVHLRSDLEVNHVTRH